MDLKNMKVIVFDLDGTLYDDTHHFDYQANVLKGKLPPQQQEAFHRDYMAIKRNDHPLKVGRVYDVLNDLILVQMNNIVQEAYDWDGKRLQLEEIQKLYREPISINFETMLNIGDPWWLSTSVAVHYGLNKDDCYDAFFKTREYMMSSHFSLKGIKGLKDALEALQKEYQLVLLTNSSEVDSETILQKIGLEDQFTLKIFNGKKPLHTIKHFQYIREYFQVEFADIISIGDNWINEIHPVKKLGCFTIFINPYGIGDETYANIVVKNMREAIPLFHKMVSK